MACPFPGIDPYIEDQDWEDFHTRFNVGLSDVLAPPLRPKYLVRVERRVYVETTDELSQPRRSDVAIIAGQQSSGAVGLATAPAGTLITPVECTVPMPVERREAYLVIREQETQQVVTIIETLSPSNKRRGSMGRREYLAKRNEILRSPTHLVEVDLVRQGERMPLEGPIARGHYYALVSRQDARPRVDVFAWPMDAPLPEIPIPLQAGDADAAVNLQTVYRSVYERAGYDLSLAYQRELASPLADRDRQWVRERLQAAGL